MLAKEESGTMTGIEGPDPSQAVDRIAARLTRRFQAEWRRRPPKHRVSHEPVMTVERATAVVACPAEGRCLPKCPHCTATTADVEVAMAWLAAHPAQKDASAIGRLAEIMHVLEHWSARPGPELPATSARWQVSDGGRTVVGGLAQEQAQAVVQQHNRQVSAALGLLDWYLGAD